MRKNEKQSIYRKVYRTLLQNIGFLSVVILLLLCLVCGLIWQIHTIRTQSMTLTGQVEHARELVQKSSQSFAEAAGSLELSSDKQANFTKNLQLVMGQLMERVVTNVDMVKIVNNKSAMSEQMAEQQNESMDELLSIMEKMQESAQGVSQIMEVIEETIRAPYIVDVSGTAEILAKVDGKIVAARQGKQLVTAFHPELNEDLSVHWYFLDMI